jgi:hypothetical protein
MYAFQSAVFPTNALLFIGRLSPSEENVERCIRYKNSFHLIKYDIEEIYSIKVHFRTYAHEQSSVHYNTELTYGADVRMEEQERCFEESCLR